MSSPVGGESLTSRIRDYYRTVSRYIDRERPGEGDRAFWGGVVRRAGEPAVLELGCGTGRITRVLARRARLVVAVDLSPEMLDRARARVGGHPRVRLLRADMRTLALSRRFDQVVAANDPFAHLVSGPDRDRALSTAARHLAPDGRLVLEGHWMSPEEFRTACGPTGFGRERTVEGNGDLTIRERWRCREETRRCTALYEYVEGAETVDRAWFRARLWSVEELERRLDRAGLELEDLWGGFDRRPFRPGSASRLLARARPAAELRDGPQPSEGRSDHL